MKVSMNWIKEYVDLYGIDINELAHKFTMSVAEVEEVIEKGKEIKNVVVGKIVSCENIPDSKKLHKVSVDVGNEIVKCVCGAPNAREGLTVPFAKIGGSIIGIPEVKQVFLAGEESNGVCCSEKEIGVSDDHSGLLELPENIKAGTDIRTLFDIDDTIIEIDNKSITNRPDLWGHYGIAREIATITGRKLKFMPMVELAKFNHLPQIPIEITDNRCLKYSCMSFENITRKEAPYQMQVRLFYCGMRSINFLVDLTNYIMLDIGQPMHAFDRNGIEKIVVRASKGENFVTLDDVVRNTDAETLFICNNNEPIAIAGIMGGKFSEVNDETKSIILESANFDAATIRRASIRMGMRTEASARYEKTLDNQYTVEALKRFVYLITELDEKVVVSSAFSEVTKQEQEQYRIEIEKRYIDKYIGEEIPTEKITEILTSLKFNVMVKDERFIIDVPSFRASKDISIKADIVEEIARIYGFDNIKPMPTKVTLEAALVNQDRECEYKTKEILANNFGLSEVHSYLWYDNKFNEEVGIGNLKGIKVLEPSAPELSDIREFMIPTLLKFAGENKKNFDEFGIFEIGSVATFDKVVNEHKSLGILTASKNKNENDMFYEMKNIIQKVFKLTRNITVSYDKNMQNDPWTHPIKAAYILYNNEVLGIISCLNPRIKNNLDKKLNIVFAEINMFKVYSIVNPESKFAEPSKYPEISFDLSLLIDKNLEYAIIKKKIDMFESDIMIGTKLVDIYEGSGLPDGKKSMTFNFRWGANDHTLTGEEVEESKKKLLDYLYGIGYESRY